MNTRMLPVETQGLLLELFQTILGTTVKVDSYRILNQHHDYYAILMTLRQPSTELVVKLAGSEAPYPYPFDCAAMFHKLVAERTSIPMAEVLAVDVSYKTYPWRYIVKTYLPGEEWRTVKPQLSTHEQLSAYHQIGTAIAELHRIRFDSFGEVDPDGAVASGGRYPSVLAARIRATIVNKHHQDLLLNLLAANSHLFAAVTQPRLCHEDLHGHNILFRQENESWRLATILDFDKAWAGHHEIDLAKLEFWTDMVGDGFWDAFNQLMDVDDSYQQRRPIYQLLWCLEYASNTPKHLADTRQLCKILNLPLIERFE